MGAAAAEEERKAKKESLPEEGGRGGRSRSRSPRGGNEDLGNIAFLHDQKLSPWHFRMSIEGSLITGPLRTSPGMARQAATGRPRRACMSVRVRRGARRARRRGTW